MEQAIRFCKAPDGVKIAYATVGEGEPLIKTANWLNHLDYDWESPVWQHLFGGLARDFKFIRYDARGNGLSDWEVDDISFEAFVTDLETVVDAARVDRFTLFGISQGASVSLAYALRHPGRVKRIIIHGGYARGWAKRDDADQIALRRAMNSLIEKGWGQDNPAFRQMWTSFYLPGGTPEQMDAWNELQRVSTSAANAIRIFEATGNIDITDLVPRVTVPVLVTHSRDEAAIPFSEGRWLAANLPNARLVGIDSRNHVLLGQEPGLAQFLSEVRSFMGVKPEPDEGEKTLMKSAPLPTGEEFGRYLIEAHLGSGGMGEVYQAEDTRLGRRVALKVLPRELALDEERRARFEREARALAALKHPNIITIYSVDDVDDRPLLVMELVRGKTVADLLPGGGFEVSRFLEIAKPLAAAMAAAHEEGITHRDLKPQNVMVDDREGVKVLDFGLAKFLPVEGGSISEALTRENMAMGTLPYMSPEQVQGNKVDHRSDIFSMGVVLYEMATGKRPFRAKHPAQIITSIMNDHPPPVDLLNPSYPAGVARAISRCMEKEVDARFASAAELVKVLSYS